MLPATLECARRRAFITETRTIIMLGIRLGFGETATGYFRFSNIKREYMLVYQSNPVGVEFFSYVTLPLGICYIICTQKSRPAK